MMDLAERLAWVERRTAASALDVATAIAYAKWHMKAGHVGCFLAEADATVSRLVKAAGLVESLATANPAMNRHDVAWSHFFAAFAAFRAAQQFSRGRYLTSVLRLLTFDSGCRVSVVDRAIPPRLHRSFWYTMGGDHLQTFIHGTKVSDEAEFRGDILGMRLLEATEGGLRHVKLSDLVCRARLQAPSIVIDAEPLMVILRANIRPKWAHHLLRAARTHAPRFYERLKLCGAFEERRIGIDEH
jgi:hypothetical protein